MIKLSDDLIPGDVLLYGGDSFFDRVIKFKTGSIAGICHVEIYYGQTNGWHFSAASRSGGGVMVYDFNPAVKVVRRPVRPFDKASAAPWLRKTTGTPYGWWDLLRFVCIKTPQEDKGLICSQFADLYLRAGGIKAFSEDYAAGSVNPDEFLMSAALDTIYWRPHGI